MEAASCCAALDWVSDMVLVGSWASELHQTVGRMEGPDYNPIQ
jgi:hypothetical protein